MDDAALMSEHDTLRREFLAGSLEPAELVAMSVLLRAQSSDLPEDDRRRFEGKLDALERLAGYGKSPAGVAPDPDSAVSRATKALREARQSGGTSEERIARAEHGIAQIRAIAADATSPSQRMAILRTTDLLARLASSLRQDSSADAGPSDRDEPPR
ncbi:hypothetical protein [Kribbella ginsengisoli]|uniref:Uncharacterized protein n=1 Tax=Kribbella ginsengisoli TaxID=363865 RepID=A0ABP6XUC7_9ACTN